MALFKRKKNEAEEPEFYMSAINSPVLNYAVYKMKKKEKALYFILAFIVGAGVGLVFYGGLGKDAYGPTTKTYVLDVVIALAAGFALGKMFLPIRQKQILSSRTSRLRTQFISLLDSLSTSISAGKNVPQSFEGAREDLAVQFSEDSYIVKEIDVITEGIKNGVQIEDMLEDLGRRSGIKDIENFGKVFEISYRKGGNMKDVIRNTHDILSKKILIEAEIETKITSGKNELNVMMIMPVLLMAMMKFSGGGFGDNFTSPTGIASVTMAIGIFVAAFFIGRAIMRIEV